MRTQPLIRRFWSSAMFIVLIVALGWLPIMLARKLQLPEREVVDSLRATLQHLQMLLLFAWAVQTAWRIIRRHPILQASYRRWLQTTPWHARLPLPLGPVWPSVADLVDMVALSTMAWIYLPLGPLLPLEVLAVSYTILATLALFRTGSAVAVALLIGEAAMIRVHQDPILFSATGALLLAIANVGVVLSLRRFPWGIRDDAWPKFKVGTLERLGPGDPGGVVSVRTAILLAGLLGWWAYCILAVCDLSRTDRANCLLFTQIIGALAGVIRGLAYGGAPPISMWGRLRTGRLILPRYDLVFLGPAATAAVAILLPTVLINAGVSFAAAIGLTATATTLSLLKAPPTYRHWALTGQYRMVFAPLERPR